MDEENDSFAYLWRGLPIALGLIGLGVLIRGVLLLDDGPYHPGTFYGGYNEGFCTGTLWILSSCFIGILAWVAQLGVVRLLPKDEPPILMINPVPENELSIDEEIGGLGGLWRGLSNGMKWVVAELAFGAFILVVYLVR